MVAHDSQWALFLLHEGVVLALALQDLHCAFGDVTQEPSLRRLTTWNSGPMSYLRVV